MTDLFRDKTKAMPADRSMVMRRSEATPFSVPAAPEKPEFDTSVLTAQTAADYRASNSYGYDTMDVKNLKRPRFGHGY
jgi:hypothetical protein